MKRRGFLKFLAAVPIALAIKPKKSEKSQKKFTQKDKERLIGKYLRTAEGRKRLAEAMRPPLRTRFNYESDSRKVLLVRAL